MACDYPIFVNIANRLAVVVGGGPDPLTVTTSTTPVTCGAADDGSITVGATG